VKAGLPGEHQITSLFDQSIFVSESINEVVRKADIAAGLTALMALLFLDSRRSTLIVCISIPLSIATSLERGEKIVEAILSCERESETAIFAEIMRSPITLAQARKAIC
jgi:Cu/Ag efflux pump CusA